MPRDRRLYMTFPIDFWQHPKVAPLSDVAFRAFVEMNGYSRMQDLDGRIPAAYARRMWKPKAVRELLDCHPDRPLLIEDGGDIVIRDYAEHQQTRADVEAVRRRNADNGRAGGLARAKRVASESLSKSLSETQAESESELEKNQDLANHPESHSAPAEDDQSLNPTIAAVVQVTAECGLRVHPLAASSVIDFIESRRGRGAHPVKVPTKYYPDAIRGSWPEVEKFIHEKGLES